MSPYWSGAGSLPAFISRYYPEAMTMVVECHAGVIHAAKNICGLPVHPNRLQVVHDDAEHFCSSAESASYDAVVVDIYSRTGIPASLRGRKFVKRLKRMIAGRGIALMNVGREMIGFGRLVDTFEDIFPYHHTFGHPDEENVVLMGLNWDMMKDGAKSR